MTLTYHPALTAPIRVPDYILVEQPSPKRYRAADIQREVCAWYGIKREDLIASGRDRFHTPIRHLAMYIVRQHTQLSYSQIAIAFGRRDHTTTIHAIKLTEQRFADDAELRADHDAIVEALRG